jgi:SAM-dependent methyltransferase
MLDAFETEHVAVIGHRPVHPPLSVDAYVVETHNKRAAEDPAGYQRITDQVTAASREAVALGIERTAPLTGVDGRAKLAASHELLGRFWGAAEEGLTLVEPAASFGYMPRWRERVPSACALWPLQQLQLGPLPFDGGAELNDHDRLFFAHVADGIGIRSRAAVMAGLLHRHFRDLPSLRWLSLAAGAAVPVLAAAQRFADAGVDLHIDLVDIDDEALRLAESHAGSTGLGGHIRTRLANLLDLEALDAVAESQERYDMVDILGFFEYLPSQPVVKSGMRVPSASDFLRAALRFVKPGGILVLGNMLDTHPQLDFVLRIVQWPYIQPRSPNELLALIAEAGVADERVTLLFPDDGVYALAVIRT